MRCRPAVEQRTTAASAETHRVASSPPPHAVAVSNASAPAQPAPGVLRRDTSPTVARPSLHLHARTKALAAGSAEPWAIRQRSIQR